MPVRLLDLLRPLPVTPFRVPHSWLQRDDLINSIALLGVSALARIARSELWFQLPAAINTAAGTRHDLDVVVTPQRGAASSDIPPTRTALSDTPGSQATCCAAPNPKRPSRSPTAR